jgi:glucuronoarabinoxylan endo-1,4-beta-xylanase
MIITKISKICITRAFSILLLIISLMAPCSTAVENPLINPGFESGNTSGWTDWGCSLSVVQDQVHSGRFGVLASGRTQSWQGPVQSILGAVEDGKTYTISGWVRLQNASEDRIGLTISQTDSNGTQYHSISWSTGYTDRWIQLSGNFTPDVTENLSSLNLYFEGPAPGVNFYLDDARVTEFSAGTPEPDATGIVDVNTVYQQLEGFGASGAWYENWLTAHPLKNEIYDCLFSQLGLDIYRIRNTYDISSGDITESAKIIQAAEVSLGHPIKVMISSWSPPAYLKSNASTAGGTLAKDASGNYMYDEFARWWADSLDEYSKCGMNADYINIQNEPDWLADWDTCKFTPTETAQWAGYNLAFEAVYQELASRMPDMPKLLAAEACGCDASNSYIDALIDPNHAYGYAHHLYADGSHDSPDGYIPAMENFAAAYGDRPLLQTEFAKGESEPLTFSDAMNLALLMHNSLNVEGASAYLYWELFWQKPKGLVSLDNPWQANPGYTINPTYYAFKQYSAFTDPGWRRVEASTDSTGLRISAFISPDANELSIVIINVSDINISLSLSLGDFSPGYSAVYRTSETEHTAYIGTFDPSQPLTLSPQSITTVSLTAPPPEQDEDISQEVIFVP